MRHLLGNSSISHTDLRQMFDSEEVQYYLRQNATMIDGPEDLQVRFVSNDDPTETLAVAWLFTGWQDAIITLLVFNDILYVPDANC